MKRYSVMLFVVVLMLGTALAANAMYFDPTADWSLNVGIDSKGDVVIAPVVDNLESLFGTGTMWTKTWQGINMPDGSVIDYLIMGLDADPVITLNFALTAGSADTTFSITSALLSFPAINGEGAASAGLTVTDLNGNGAAANGLISGPKFYEATYNGSSVFGQLVNSPISTGIFGSVTGSESISPWVSMGSVSSMQARFNFTLSAHDSASGTSVYSVREVPEPTCLGVLAMGLVGLVARRRRS